MWIWKAEAWIVNLSTPIFKMLVWTSLARAEAEKQKHPENEGEELLCQEREHFPKPMIKVMQYLVINIAYKAGSQNHMADILQFK